jgi:hypothetical protein
MIPTMGGKIWRQMVSADGAADLGAMGIGGCVHPFATAQFLIIGKSTWVFVVHFQNNGKYTGRKNAKASAMKAPFTLFAKGFTFHS